MACGILHNSISLVPTIPLKVLLDDFKEKHHLVKGVKKQLKEINIDNMGLSEDQTKSITLALDIFPDYLEKFFSTTMDELEHISNRNERLVYEFRQSLGFLKDGQLALEKINLNDLINDALMINESLSSNITIDCHIDKSIEVNSSKKHLSDVFVNIIKNACESMTQSESLENNLSISVNKVDSNDTLIKVTFQDTGVGFIDANDLFQYGVTSKKEGFGVGLSYSKSILSYLNGKIIAESEGEGKGAQITVQIPL